MGEMKISRFTDSTEISYKKKHAQLEKTMERATVTSKK